MASEKNTIESGLAEMAVLRKKQVCHLLAISPATLDRKRAKGDFPAPIKLGEQAVGWTRLSILAWLEARPVAPHFVESLEF